MESSTIACEFRMLRIPTCVRERTWGSARMKRNAVMFVGPWPWTNGE
jgi:hypothetical protein